MSVLPTQGDILEVAILESQETLTREDSRSLFDNLIYLGTTTSEIKVKVTYRYHIKISDSWELSPNKNVLNVVAPQILASLPPAIDTATLQKRSDEGWMRFNAAENLDKLEKSISSTLVGMSMTPAKIDLVKDSSRKAIEKFVRTWILNQEKWKKYHFDNIVIYFPDEKKNLNLM